MVVATRSIAPDESGIATYGGAEPRRSPDVRQATVRGGGVSGSSTLRGAINDCIAGPVSIRSEPTMVAGAMTSRGSAQTKLAAGAPGPQGQPLTRSSVSSSAEIGDVDVEQQARAVADFAESCSTVFTPDA